MSSQTVSSQTATSRRPAPSRAPAPSLSAAAPAPPRPTAPALSAAVAEALLASLPVGVMLAGADGRLLYLNAAARRLRADGEVPPQRRLRPDGPVAWATDLALARALLTGEVVRDEVVEYAGAGRRRRWVRIGATPVRDAAGAVRLGVLTVADATAERHEADWAPTIEALARL